MLLLLLQRIHLLHILKLYELSEHASWRERLFLVLFGLCMALLSVRLLTLLRDLAADVARVIIRETFLSRAVFDAL
jgi:hypothetical protein